MDYANAQLTGDDTDHPKNVMDGDREGLMRIGIYWHGLEYTIFWINSTVPPTIAGVTDFALRHPGVALELFEQDISPEDFAADWDAKRRVRIEEAEVEAALRLLRSREKVAQGEVDKATVAVLLPPDWKEVSARKSIVALIYKSGRIRKRDVYAVGWQGERDDILQVVMHTKKGAGRLVRWVDAQRDEGIWDVYAERNN